MDYHISIEEAISNGRSSYWDSELCVDGRSGGIRCPRCKEWYQKPRKRKNHEPVYLIDCESCEEKDPIRRVFHEVNRFMNDDMRKEYNVWRCKISSTLQKLRESTSYTNPGGVNKDLNFLKELMSSIPFFEIMQNEV